jgi:hypothetical protein
MFYSNKKKEKEICIVFGNCAAKVIAWLLSENDHFTENHEIIYHRSFTHPGAGKASTPLEKIKRCSILLVQKGHMQSPGFMADIFPTCTVVSFPVLNLHTLWPFYRMDPRNKPEPGFEFGRYPYGDLQVMKLLKEKLPPEEVFKQYMEINIKEKVDLSAIYQEEITKGKILDAQCDIPLYDYVEENFKKKRLFFTPNHPTPDLSMYAVGKILDRLRFRKMHLSVHEKIMNVLPLGKYHHPIHPQIIRYFDLKWITPGCKYRYYDGSYWTFEAYIKKYIEFA